VKGKISVTMATIDPCIMNVTAGFEIPQANQADLNAPLSRYLRKLQ
jgi:hypothetical protein